MRSLVIVLALSGCTESDADQLLDLKDQTQLTCWRYFSCENGGQTACPPPATPVADGVACMNDAIATGKTAMAAWGRDTFNPWERRESYVFAIDHGIRVFTSVTPGVDPTEVTELHGCTPPFAASPGMESMTSSGCSEF